jgi:hypothetical protein
LGVKRVNSSILFRELDAFGFFGEEFTYESKGVPGMDCNRKNIRSN